MSNNYNPLNNWGNQKIVTKQDGERTTIGVERTGSLWSWVLVIGAILLAAKWLGI